MQKHPPDTGTPTAEDCFGVLNALTAARRRELHEQGIAQGVAVCERQTILGEERSVVRFIDPADCWALFTPVDLDAGRRLGDAYSDWIESLHNVIAHARECAAAWARGEHARYDVTAAAERHKRASFARYGVLHVLTPTCAPRRTVAQPRVRSREHRAHAARRVGASSATSSSDPGDDGPGEPTAAHAAALDRRAS